MGFCSWACLSLSSRFRPKAVQSGFITGAACKELEPDAKQESGVPGHEAPLSFSLATGLSIIRAAKSMQVPCDMFLKLNMHVCMHGYPHLLANRYMQSWRIQHSGLIDPSAWSSPSYVLHNPCFSRHLGSMAPSATNVLQGLEA